MIIQGWGKSGHQKKEGGPEIQALKTPQKGCEKRFLENPARAYRKDFANWGEHSSE